MSRIDIDTGSLKKDRVFYESRKYFRSIGGDFIRVGTFKTESAKSDVRTVCRGMGINNDVATYMSSLIPVERGNVWSIKDCYYGNPKEDRMPVTEFKNLVDQYDGLLDALILCEDLISGIGIHASGVLPTNKPIWECNNSVQKAPNGELITAYDLHQSEWGGSIKMDYLNTAAESMIQLCLESLVKSGHMEWQGSLRKTYEKYLLPEVLDLTTEEMWDLACAGKILSLFQMDSIQGKKVMRAINPHSLLQLANTNSLMRLQSKTKEQPIDQYIRYKNDINEWYRDMDAYGLTKNEQEILKEHLLESYGVCAEQEPLMKISMDKRICGFDIVKSNKLRKGIAKFWRVGMKVSILLESKIGEG